MPKHKNHLLALDGAHDSSVCLDDGYPFDALDSSEPFSDGLLSEEEDALSDIGFSDNTLDRDGRAVGTVRKTDLGGNFSEAQAPSDGDGVYALGSEAALPPSPEHSVSYGIRDLVLNLGKPSSKQAEFLRDTHPVVGYGGARGGGKSWAIRVKAILMALAYPGIRQLIVRRTYPELINNHILPLRSILGKLISYNDRDKRMEFLAGGIETGDNDSVSSEKSDTRAVSSSHRRSTINFGYCDSESDLLQYQGQEYDVIYIDEATQLTERQIRVIRACIRGVNAFPKRLYLTCNPGGRGHSYVKRILIDRDYASGERAEDYNFISARVTDNIALLASQPDYVSQLDALPDNLRRAWRDGDWDACEGAYFSEFSRNYHVIRPFELNPSWRRYRAFDYGLDCFACLWFAIDGDENVYVYREFSAPDLPISEAASACLRNTTSAENVYATFAPPDMWSRSQETGRQKVDVFRASGLQGIVKASNDREAGWLCIKELLRHDASSPPRLRIFDTCRNLIRFLPLLQTDPLRPTDCLTQPHEYTHICDALRYFAVSRARPASPRSAPPPDISSWPSDLIDDFLSASPSLREKILRDKGIRPL